MRIAKSLLALLFLPAASVAAADIVLVDEGKPVATIIIRQDAEGPVKAAAEALQGYFKQMSGATLPIATDADVVQGSRVLIGSSKATAAIKEDLSKARLGYDGCVVMTRGKDVVFLGSRDEGAANGVYWFLEWKLGVHRFSQRNDGLVVPQKKTVTVKDFSYAHEPCFAWRASWIDWGASPIYFHTPEERQNLPIYLTFNRAGGVSLSGAHSLESLVPRSLFEQHPEYFPLINGQRQPRGQLCLSNPGVLDLVVSKLMALPADSEDFVSVSPNDEPGWCECDDCLRMAKDPAARMMLFCNKVIEALEPTHPNLGACFLAYTYSETMNPPLGLEAHPRVVPLIAPLGTCEIHPIESDQCPDAAELRRVCEGWRSVAEKVTVYPYEYADAVPLPTPGVGAKEIKYFYKIGLFGIERQHMGRGLGEELNLWTEWQLLWDGDQDVNALRDVFLQGYFGEGAPAMKRIYDRVDAAVQAIPVGTKGRGGWPRPPGNSPLYEGFVEIRPGYTNCAASLAAALDQVLPACRLDVRQALRLASTPATKAHVEMEKRAIDATSDYVAAELAYEQWRQAPSQVDPEKTARRINLSVDRLDRMSKQPDQLYVIVLRDYLKVLLADVAQSQS